ncbi:MAG: glutamate--tRNA ligase [Desulfovibrionaceae bacterium]|nr:glutamate--tRNA ligase [Desulfovibrionaceae bacterium]
MSQVVTRFAPSPTGFLHIGGARTALFSWLMARQAKGRFLLRIEDTDRERSTDQAIEAILASMRWLGLNWDGEAVYQSRRIERHNQAVDELVRKGRAYWCECPPEEVQAMRDRARQRGLKPKYDGTCREKGLGPGPGRAVRLKTPLSGSTSYQDLVKGPIVVDNQELDDMVLRRSDGTPTYNLAVVVDDHDMGVSHVLRGDDHVNNTPRQITIYRAMGWPEPAFGHVPMILGPDKKKLSKRHGALSVMEYERLGYLPEALVNYLARLGWSCGDKEIFSRQELVELFSVDNLGSSAAVFDLKKLDWLNSQYIQAGDQARLAGLLAEFVNRRTPGAGRAEDLARVVPLLKPRAKTMVEMADKAGFFVADARSLAYDQKAVDRFLDPQAKALIREFAAALEEAAGFSRQALEQAAKSFLDRRGLKFKALAQPVRVAISGAAESPGLFETMEALGRDQTLGRLKRAADL